MFKEFMIKKMLASKLSKSGISKEDQEKLLTLISNNPDFFMKITGEIEKKIQSGQDQMSAMMSVFKDHEEELKKIMAQ